MDDCVFCKIASKQIPCFSLYEDDDVIAFLDIAPATKKGGHTLVIPKKHYESITEVPDELLAKIMAVVKKITNAILKDADGVNVLQNNGKAAGQFVKHIHFHIVPRYNDDKIGITWECEKYDGGEIEKEHEKLKKLLEECLLKP
ncbi:MAG: HIT family protein [Nanoarchaeota archaeon]|nr:HIT family protein [Nanoarchaeota archaeon]